MPARNDYSGHRVLPGETVPRVQVTDLTPASFFDDFVARRRPCVIVGLPSELVALRKWSNSYLRALAGDAEVEVELRADETGLFGQGETTAMWYSELLSKLEEGSQRFYMTTQTLPTDGEGRPAVTSSPVTELVTAGDIPLRPEILGSLVPMCLNLWQGNSKDGASSGLHHDYHDNLYVLIRGRKRFRLYSPADADLMYTVGNLEHVHPNGRINYEGFPTRPDGANAEAVLASEADEVRRVAEAEVAAAEAAAARGEAGSAQRLAAAEEKLDAALEAVLMAEMEGADDYDDDQDEEDIPSPPPPRKRPRASESKADDAADPRQTPLNFSRVVDPSESAGQTRSARFPRFSEATPVFCEVAAEEMLYLPAGWFHEVTSQSLVVDGATERSVSHGHLALNFWVHPPDNSDFSCPYSSDFWQRDWTRREEEAAQIPSVSATSHGKVVLAVAKKVLDRTAGALPTQAS